MNELLMNLQFIFVSVGIGLPLSHVLKLPLFKGIH